MKYIPSRDSLVARVSACACGRAGLRVFSCGFPDGLFANMVFWFLGMHLVLQLLAFRSLQPLIVA